MSHFKINDKRLLYNRIYMGTLWNINKRDNKYGSNKYHGNFVPDISHYFINRFTKKGEIVWDCFAGSGTTIDVAKKLNRNVISNDINPQRDDITYGNSILFKPDKSVQLLIMHPPYADVIKYSKLKEDLSNTSNPNEYYKLFDDVVKNCLQYLDNGRMVVLVIADVWFNKQLEPLAFKSMEILRQNGCTLRGIIIKDWGNLNNVMPYSAARAFKGGYFIYEHEYIFLLQKAPKSIKYIDMTDNIKHKVRSLQELFSN